MTKENNDPNFLALGSGEFFRKRRHAKNPGNPTLSRLNLVKNEFGEYAINQARVKFISEDKRVPFVCGLDELIYELNKLNNEIVKWQSCMTYNQLVGFDLQERVKKEIFGYCEQQNNESVHIGGLKDFIAERLNIYRKYSTLQKKIDEVFAYDIYDLYLDGLEKLQNESGELLSEMTDFFKYCRPIYQENAECYHRIYELIYGWNIVVDGQNTHCVGQIEFVNKLCDDVDNLVREIKQVYGDGDSEYESDSSSFCKY